MKDAANSLFDDDSELSLEEADQNLYGGTHDVAVTIPRSGRVTALPIGIFKIRPDLQQPRRAIPMVVRGAWDGSPDELEDILVAFHDYAEAEHGSIDVKAILLGHELDWTVPQESATDAPIFKRYANIINLAGNILNEGLTNPITVVKLGSGYQIETGESRWWAFHLLAKFIDGDKYGKIPAREVEYDPFRQASENNARSELTAIEMSRQVALLVMALLNDLHDYTPMDQMVLPGESDRRFYAQVANGYVHSVPEVLRPKIQKAVRGLAWNSISNYRSLTALFGNDDVDDALWNAADTYGWAEGALRELKVARDWDDTFIDQYVAKLHGLISDDRWDYDDLKEIKRQATESFTIVKLQKKKDEEARLNMMKLEKSGDPIKTEHGDLMGKWVRLDNGTVGLVSFHKGNDIRLELKSGTTTYASPSVVVAVDVDPRDGESGEERRRAAEYFGKAVMVDIGGHEVPGIVQSTAGLDTVRVLTKSGDVIEAHVDQLQIDDSITPDKSTSQTLAGYYDTPPATKTDGKNAVPTGIASESERQNSIRAAEAQKLFKKYVLTPSRKRGRVIQIEGEWLTVQFANGSTEPQHYMKVRVDSDQSHPDTHSVSEPKSEDSGLAITDTNVHFILDRLEHIARTSDMTTSAEFIWELKRLTQDDVDEMRKSKTLNHHLGRTYGEIADVLDKLKAMIDVELSRIEDGK